MCINTIIYGIQHAHCYFYTEPILKSIVSTDIGQISGTYKQKRKLKQHVALVYLKIHIYAT